MYTPFIMAYYSVREELKRSWRENLKEYLKGEGVRKMEFPSGEVRGQARKYTNFNDRNR